VTILDLDRELTVEPGRFLSRSRNTPFKGWTLTGGPVMTIVGGTLVAAADGAIAASARGTIAAPKNAARVSPASGRGVAR
jgi:dihydroorotase-like cyclic amidohydrolase